MDFPFDLHMLLDSDRVVSVWDSAALGRRRQNPMWGPQMAQLIDTMGKLSAKAQSLPGPITTQAKLLGTDQRLYLYVDQNQAMGILKVGKKKLFIRNPAGACREIEPLCVLDFYVHESCQRTGIGRLLFEVMLASEQAQPHALGYDRPSPKLLGFLARHYGLSSYFPQANSFVVFDAYFDPDFIRVPGLKSRARHDLAKPSLMPTTSTTVPWAIDTPEPIPNQRRSGQFLPHI